MESITPKIGRPLKFTSPEELELVGNEYFKTCEEKNEPFTITGLALALDTSRKVLMEYEGRDEFSNTIKRLKQRCENYAEKRLFGNNPTGAIFALKNYNWKDRQEVEHGGNLNINVVSYALNADTDNPTPVHSEDVSVGVPGITEAVLNPRVEPPSGQEQDSVQQATD